MTWEDRIRPAAYTSPSGERLEFEYRDVSRATPKRTTAFEFIGVNGAYIQDRGFGARKYPLQCYFSGPDCDILATRFEAALLERGRGRLEHPLYGTFDVVPYGEVSRRDDLATAANQAIVEVTFWTSLRSVYPTGEASSPSEILAAADAFNLSVAAQFASGVDYSTVQFQEAGKSTFGSVFSQVGSSLTAVANGRSSTQARFRALRNAAITGLDAVITQPAIIAFEMAELIQLPARDAAQFASMSDAYSSLLESVLALPQSLPWLSNVPAGSRAEANRANGVRVSDATVTAIASAVAIAGMSAGYKTRGAAVEAADDVLGLFDDVVAWRDAAYGAIGETDTGEAYQALVGLVSLAAGYLLEVSFSLPAERRVTLSRPRALLELAAELYGEVDGALDLLIQTNNLMPSEILEIPRGREIVFYV